MKRKRFPGCRVAETATLEDDVTIGEGSAIWNNVHIRHGSHIGRHCIVGENSYLAYGVHVGDYCKLNSSVYICAGVTIADHVMVAAHVVFTNDRYPRAFDRVLGALAQSEPTEDTLECHVGRGATIGANATIGSGLVIGPFAMVGMGAVVTKDIPAHGLVVGNPARLAGFVCACGPLLVRAEDLTDETSPIPACQRCSRKYERRAGTIVETSGPQSPGRL